MNTVVLSGSTPHASRVEYISMVSCAKSPLTVIQLSTLTRLLVSAWQSTTERQSLGQRFWSLMMFWMEPRQLPMWRLPVGWIPVKTTSLLAWENRKPNLLIINNRRYQIHLSYYQPYYIPIINEQHMIYSLLSIKIDNNRQIYRYMSVKQDERHKIKVAQRYLAAYVTPIMDQLIADLLTNKPTNVIGYSLRWFQQQQSKLLNSNNGESELEEDEVEISKQAYSRRRRGGILETRYQGEVEESLTAPNSEYEKSKVLFNCAQLFMFKSFQDEDMKKLLRCVVLKEVKEEEMLFDVDDEIDGMYIMNSGELVGRDRAGNQKKVYGVDSVIGELSLLHYVQSHESMMATKHSTLYKISKAVYNTILNVNREKERERLNHSISQTVFRNMTLMEKAQLASILIQDTVREGSQVPRLEEDESRIIMVESGNIELARKKAKGASEVMKVYSPGDHIEEDTVDYRAFVLSAKTQSKILSVRKTAFARLFGSYQRFLLRQKSIKKSKSKIKESRHE